MQSSRKTALQELERLAGELKNTKKVYPDKTLEEELGKTCTSANTDLPKTMDWIEAIISKVRGQFSLSWRCVPLIHFVRFLKHFGRNRNSGRACRVCLKLSLIKMKLCRGTWQHIKLAVIAMDTMCF